MNIALQRGERKAESAGLDHRTEAEANEYAARHVSQRYAIEIALAKTISRLAGLGVDEVRQ